MVHDMQIDYDDDILDILEKVNKALSKYNLEFVNDDLPHEGFCLYNLVEKNKTA
jgi:hypothetical protein